MTDLYICEHSRSPCAACAEAARVPWLRAEVRRLQALADARLVEIDALRQEVAQSAQSESPPASGIRACHPFGEKE